MKRAAPNGRDYYVEPGLLQKAEEQHRRRLQVIHDLREELETEVQQLDEKYPDAR
jgi:cell division protein FtsB